MVVFGERVDSGSKIESEGDGCVGGKPSVCGIFRLKDRPLMLLL
jgi:hypothetical protein